MEHRSTRIYSAFSILIVFLVCCLIGLALSPLLSIQLLPSRTYPTVIVSCNLPGASQEVVEQEITNPLENTLAHLKGIKSINSTTRSGNAEVWVELDQWTDPEMFRFEVSAQLRQLEEALPEEASYPQVSLSRPDNSSYRSSMLGYSLNGPEQSKQLGAYVEKTIQPALAEIPGIAEVSVSGIQPERYVLISHPEKLRQAGLSYNDLLLALIQGKQNKSLGMVDFIQGPSREVQIQGAIASFEDLDQFPVKRVGDRIVRLGDVADMKQELVEPRSYYRINGQDLVSISIFPQEHVNTLKVARAVREKMQELQSTLPQGYRLALSYDTTEYISQELGKIYLRTGLSVAILLLFVFMITRRWRYLMIVVLSILVNVLLSFIFYYAFNLEIHLYSLAGITISIGLIIDNVIVIVEDIRHTGRNRIFAAILASTFTALGALSVIFLLEESQRLNLLDFAIAIIINLIVSLPVAYFFIPALLEQFPVQIKKSPTLVRRRRWVVRFSRFYTRQVRFMLTWRWAFVLLFILAFGLPLFMLPDTVKSTSLWGKAYNYVFDSDFYKENLKGPLSVYLGGASYLYIRNADHFGYTGPDEEREVSLFARIAMPNGATLTQMDQVTREWEAFLKTYPKEISVFTARVSSPNTAVIEIHFNKGYDTLFPLRLKQQLEEQAILSGSADFTVYGVGRAFNNAVNLENFDSSIALKGYSYPQLQALALQIRDTLLNNPRVADVFISADSWYQSKPLHEYRVHITQPEQLALYGLSRRRMSGALLEHQLQDRSLGTISYNDNAVSLALTTDQHGPPAIWSTMEAPLALNDSSMRRLTNLSSISNVRQGTLIRRENQEYLLNVHYRFIGSYMLNQMIRDRVIKQMNEEIPYGYSVYTPSRGWDWGSKESLKNLWYIPLVLLIIYMICAVLLESFRQPFAVILMIPFSFIGVFLIFYILKLQFNQGGYAALLMLSGLVTNVALYIINDINFIRRQYTGASLRHNIRIYIKAFNAKAMPIGITTASAMLSLLPFMLNGEEAGFWFTLSAGTIGGLLFSLLGAYLMLPMTLLHTRDRKIFKTDNHD